MFTGRLIGTTNFVDNNPLPVSAQLLQRGQQRFTIYCSPCHGQEADGMGITRKIGAMAVVANLHDKRIVEMADGEIFHVITNGRNLMGAYGPNITVEDRWAIIAYLRALQLSQLGTLADLPPELQAHASLDRAEAVAVAVRGDQHLQRRLRTRHSCRVEPRIARRMPGRRRGEVTWQA